MYIDRFQQHLTLITRGALWELLHLFFSPLFLGSYWPTCPGETHMSDCELALICVCCRWLRPQRSLCQQYTKPLQHSHIFNSAAFFNTAADFTENYIGVLRLIIWFSVWSVPTQYCTQKKKLYIDVHQRCLSKDFSATHEKINCWGVFKILLINLSFSISVFFLCFFYSFDYQLNPTVKEKGCSEKEFAPRLHLFDRIV